MSVEFEKKVLSLNGGFIPSKPKFEFLYRLIADCGPPIEIGNVEKGFLKVIPIIGGQFEGPKLKGIVLPIGADWNTENHYQSTTKGIDTRYILQTDDGVNISLSTKGYVQQSEEIMLEKRSGHPVDPDTYYFRQHLFFECGDERYSWINNVVAIGSVMSKTNRGVIYDAYIIR
ncbi:DUF3237 domain-containing protein [Bacillus sp. Marseille-P3661]|uniref:DUF3237 domain-containing protein n=1 Tax=Bacillus sp. Marseille-P3661 TaxID=1936234 RepID=UPI000C81841C|nr:DUF3237 domain-containing protein [Bacillus sp. Marseille-P3661]